MKFRTLIAAMAVALSAPALAADKHDHAHAHTPMHGGIVAEANDFDFELVAQPDRLTIHVRDHGKPVATQGASGKVTVLSGARKVEAPLIAAGDSRLESKGDFAIGAGSKIVATLTLGQGRPINVRFAAK